MVGKYNSKLLSNDFLISTLPNDFIISKNLNNNYNVETVTNSSKNMKDNSIFFAIKGFAKNGEEYIQDVLKYKNITIILESSNVYNNLVSKTNNIVLVKEIRKCFSLINSEFYGNPKDDLRFIGVTGTNGKTSTSWILHSLLSSQGIKAGLLSTEGYRCGNDKICQYSQHLTTPEPNEIHRILLHFKCEDCKIVIIEASSHALFLDRLYGINFEIGLFTNLSSEHLDFHKTMNEYLESKLILFNNSNKKIINCDCKYLNDLHNIDKLFKIGKNSSNDYKISNIENTHIITYFMLEVNYALYEIESHLLGIHNVYNLAMAIAATNIIGFDMKKIIKSIPDISQIPGRLEFIELFERTVIIDFGHTPDSIKEVLLFLRKKFERIITLVGSAGGNRDPGKRSPIGYEASKNSDYVIFTEEDCRNTPIEKILKQMESGALKTNKKNYELIPNRREAIKQTAKISQKKDAIVFFGKGVEKTLERKFEIVEWSEKKEIIKIYNEFFK